MAVLTLNPANKGAAITLAALPWETSGNLLATTAATSGWQCAVGTVSQSSGKWYFESTYGFGSTLFGLCNASVNLNNYLGGDANSFGLQNVGVVQGGGGTSGWTATAMSGDRIGLAVDVTAKKFWVRSNGGAWLNGDPVAGTGGGTYAIAGAVFPAVALAGTAAVVGLSFVAAQAIGGSAHGFSAAPPTGFAAWGDLSSYATPAQTFDPGWKDTTTTLSGGNLVASFNTGVSGANSGWRTQTATRLITAGQYYCEIRLNALGTGGHIGISIPMPNIQDYPADNSGSMVGVTGAVLWDYAGGVYTPAGNYTAGAVASFTVGDVIGIAIDLGLKRVWLRKNGGAWIGGTSPNPTTGTGGYDITLLLAHQGGVMPVVAGQGVPGFTLTALAPFAFAGPWDIAVAPASGAVLVTGRAPTGDATVRPASGAVLVTGRAPTTDANVAPGAGAVLVTGRAPTADATVAPTTGLIRFRGQAAGIGSGGLPIATPPVVIPSDLLLTWDNDSFRADMMVTNGDLAVDQGLRTALIISLMTDALAPADAVIPDGTDDRRGTWMDLPLDTDADLAEPDHMGSLLWLLSREKQMPEVLRRAEYYIRQATKWMITDGIVDRIDAAADFPRLGWIRVQCTLWQGAWPTIFDAMWPLS